MKSTATAITLLALVVLSFTTIHAQQWKRLPGPTGASFSGLAVSTVDPDFIVTQVQSVNAPYFTTNGGATWQQMGAFPSEWWGAGVSALSIVSGTKQTVRLIFDRWVVQSSDLGATWTKSSEMPNSNMRQLMIHPTNPNYWFAWGMSPPVLRSTNAGENWDTVFASKQFGLSNVVVSPAAAHHMYLEVKDSLFESLDTGRTWQQVAYSGVQTYSMDLLAADHATADRLYAYFQGRIAVSSDRGRTWTDKTQRNVLSVDGIAQDASDNNMLYAWGTNVLLSTDQGNSWTPIDTMHTTRMSAVLHQRQLYVSCYQSGVFRGSVGGTSWERLDRGINRLETKTVITLSDRTWFVQGVNDVMRTTDAGETWTFLTPVKYDQPSGGRVYAFDVSRSDPSRMIGGTNADIYHSTNGGESWLESSPRQNEPIYAISIHPTNALDVVCGGLYNLKRSKDGGVTWKNAQGQSINGIAAIGRNPVAPLHLLAADDENVYSTVDGGDTWTKHAGVVNEPHLIIGDANDGSTFYVSGGSGVKMTTDNGATWKNPWNYNHTTGAIVQDPRNGDVLWVSQAGGYGNLMRFVRSTGTVDTVYQPDWRTEGIILHTLAIVGDTIIGSSNKGLMWFDPTPVSVREGAGSNSASFRDDELVRRQVIDLHGVVLYADVIRGEQIRMGYAGVPGALPTGIYLVHLSTASRATTVSVIHLR